MTEPGLREALEAELVRVGQAPLSAATARLVEVYRSGAPPQSLAVRTEVDAAAYAAYRMPATHAAVCRALGHLASAIPRWRPSSLVDLGGGTGAAAWAATSTWPSLTEVTILDASAAALAAGRRVAANHPALARARWQPSTLPGPVPCADLTLVSYLLGELSTEAATALVADLATHGSGSSRDRSCNCVDLSRVVVVVEPGTPRGYAAVLAARTVLLDHGWTLLGPCPHALPCPLAEGDWCHDSVRLARSALHRRVKGGELGHEDERFSWLAATPLRSGLSPDGPGASRVLRHPLTRKGLVQLELCRPDGTSGRQVVSKRHGTAYKDARDVRWGDLWPTPERPD